ncbi:MAG: hypothetical protein ABJM43_13810 [Paracoccaceae bacterium]
MDTATNETTANAATDHATLPVGTLVLIGIFGSDTDLECLVRTDSGKIKRVKRGMQLDNATVAAIAHDRILLSRGPSTEILTFPIAKTAL